VNTGLAESLYKLSAFTYVGFRAHDFDVQRFASLLSDLQEPFVGANSLLKGDEQIGDYTALRAADILDTLIHQNMSNRLAELAEAGFEAARPNPDEDSNHEYERLFRVARDAISDGVTKNASRDEMVEMVAGDVMKAAARARSKNARGSEDEKYASERYTREPAEEFARIFIDDVFEDMCDGEFYELRRLENKLASGYNAAIRRHLQEWFDEHSD
jgi:CRISPR type I-D-associated protein Csc3/Cas10d